MKLFFFFALTIAFSFAGQEEKETTRVPLQSIYLQKYHFYQSSLPLCAVLTEIGVLTAYTGEHYPLDQMIEWYYLSGTLKGDSLDNSGVPIEKIGAALAVKGYTLERVKAPDILRAESFLERGYAVLAIVNPYRYWSPTNPMNDFGVDLMRRYGLSVATHVVWVTAIDRERAIIWLNDTAVEAAPIGVQIGDFNKAFVEAGGRLLVVRTVLPVLDPDSDGVPLKDEDYDGFPSITSGGSDCDDHDAAANPGAFEKPYDGIDQNCDGNDVNDVDGDGVASTRVGGTDCDDTNPMISPKSIEICDYIDNNCDGHVDENLERYYYIDRDRDGFGDNAKKVLYKECDPSRPVRVYVSNNYDCDDYNAYIGKSCEVEYGALIGDFTSEECFLENTEPVTLLRNGVVLGIYFDSRGYQVAGRSDKPKERPVQKPRKCVSERLAVLGKDAILCRVEATTKGVLVSQCTVTESAKVHY